MNPTPYPAGAFHRQDAATFFRVWAPLHDRVELLLESGPHPMTRAEQGYFELEAHAPPGAKYRYLLSGGGPFPDPASRHQPEGVDGPSAVVEGSDFASPLNWKCPPLEDFVIYELHVGTFTQAGTFDAAISELARLQDLGITAVEIMPVAQFSGSRNWGYDGVFPYAVQNSYGGPDGLRRFIRACHRRRLAVVLDVVYNHVGPEGCCMDRFGPYFRPDRPTPWGPGINFDGPQSRPVRDFFLGSAEMWFREFGVDALRIDAIDAIRDRSIPSFPEELTRRVRKLEEETGIQALLFAETDSGSQAYARSPAEGGLGMDAQWANAFHHAVHCRLSGEKEGYFRYWGASEQIAEIFRYGFQGYCSRRPIEPVQGEGGRPLLHPHRLVAFNQNHDLIGNRLAGDRASARMSAAQLRLSAAALLLSPFTPLIFMGEEYAELAPFHYFVDFVDPTLREMVANGRLREFAGWNWPDRPVDASSLEPFERSRLRKELREKPAHRAMESFYRRLIELRRQGFGFKGRDWEELDVELQGDLISIRSSGALLLLNFGGQPTTCSLAGVSGRWRMILDSSEPIGEASRRRSNETASPLNEVRLRAFSAALLKKE